MWIKTYESFIAERGFAGFSNFDNIKQGNVIEYVIPGTGITATGKVVDKGNTAGHKFVILVDDKSSQRIKVFIDDTGVAYEHES